MSVLLLFILPWVVGRLVGETKSVQKGDITRMTNNQLDLQICGFSCNMRGYIYMT